LSLPDCIEAALSNNETVKIQELKVEEIKAKVWAKTASMLPNLGLNAGYNRLRTDADNYNAALVLTQPLFAGGKYWYDRGLAKLELEQAELMLEKTKQELSLDVAAAYYLLWYAQEILSANIRSHDNLQSYYNRSRQLSEQTRLLRPEELLQIKVQLGNSKMAVENATLDFMKAGSALRNLLITVPVKMTDQKEEPFFNFTSAQIMDVPAIHFAEPLKSYAYRLALLAERQYELAARASAGAYWPQINLQAYSGLEWGDTFPQDETRYSQWGVSLQMLLFDFFKTPKQVEQSNKAWKQADLASEQIRRDFMIRQLDFHMIWEANRRKINLADQNLRDAEASLKLYQERGQSYTANSKQLLDAEQAALQAKISYLVSILDYNLNFLELKRLQGENL